MGSILVVRREKRLVKTLAGDIWLSCEKTFKIPALKQPNRQKSTNSLRVSLQSEIERVFAKWPKEVQTT